MKIFLLIKVIKIKKETCLIKTGLCFGGLSLLRVEIHRPTRGTRGLEHDNLGREAIHFQRYCREVRQLDEKHTLVLYDAIEVSYS